MLVSTKGRYALRVMLDIAGNSDGNYLPLKEIAARQGISLKYLEGIMNSLVKAELVEVMHGRSGGYRLKDPPEKCTAADILTALEGPLVPIACLEPDAEQCARSEFCATLPMWTRFAQLTQDYFDSITLADLLK